MHLTKVIEIDLRFGKFPEKIIPLPRDALEQASAKKGEVKFTSK